MAVPKNKQSILEHNTPEVPPDHELFAGEVQETPAERDVFVGNEDFYSAITSGGLADSAQPAGANPRERFSTIQKIIAGSIIAIVAMLLYELLKTPSRPATNIPASPAAQSAIHPVGSGDTSPQAIEKSGPTAQSPLSLKVAETFYSQKNYDKAYTAYNQLYQSLSTKGDDGPLVEFLKLRMALCLRKTADAGSATMYWRSSPLKTLLQSSSPIVRMSANYHLGIAEVESGQYLKARTRAYQTIALTGAPDLDKDWVLSIQRDCYFIAAESITRNILSLCDADKDTARDLWEHPEAPDPFSNLDEAQLRSVLLSGSEYLRKGVLGPQIQKFENTERSPRWSVVCDGASIDELLARFATNAGIDISWVAGTSVQGENTNDSIRKRPVSLCLPAVTVQEFATAAAGHVGLLARIDEKGRVNIFDPTEYSSLSQHLSLLIPEAISLWQRFLLTFHDDRRIPNAHFALGLLYSQNGEMMEAIAEYKLVANRFSQTPLAPSALLNSSKLKAGLRDYRGAREDLRQLIEQYPDNEFYGQACLHLADATMKAGLWEEAARLYRKVYNLAPSPELQTAAALGAGRCSYESQDYTGAAEWLARYVALARNHESNEVCRAYFLLGKTNMTLGKLQEACGAFQCALAGQLSRGDYVETVVALVETKMQQQHFVEALGLLENVQPWQFSQQEYIEILLAKCKILRSMGLVDKAIATLGEKAAYLADPQLKAKVSFELAECLADEGDLERARDKLTEILTFVEPGPFAQQVTVRLAEVSLKLGQDAQVISICSRLLDSQPTPQIRQKALNILATVYQRQKNYDKAATVILDQRNKDRTPDEKGPSSSTTAAGK